MSTYITETYALKYYGECMNYRKQQSRVEIWQKGSVGSSYPRKIGDITGLSLAINGNEDIDAPIVKTILNLSMADTWDEVQIESANATKHGAWEEFYTPDSTAYLVKLFTKEDGDTNWEHRWSGYITPDNWQETIGYRGQVGIVARDNLGHLQDFDFDLDGNADGLASAYDIIDAALAKIAFPMNVDIGDEASGGRALLLETDAASGSRGLFDACLSVDNFKGESWEKVFKDVLDSLGLTVRFVDGNTVVITFIRNLSLCGNLWDPVPQTIEFYGNGTRMLVPAYKDVRIESNFNYKSDVIFPAKVLGAYGTNENFHWLYWDERRQQNVSGDAARTDVEQTGRGWFSLDKAFVNPASYFITGRGGGGAIVDTDTTALLIANATSEDVRMASAGYTFGKVNSPAATVSLNVTASFTLSGRYLLRSGSLVSYEWTAAYVAGLDAFWWNGSQWKNTQAVWTETTDNRIDFSAPMNLRDMPEGGVLTIFVRNIKATTGFCIGINGVTMEGGDPSTSLKSDLVTVVNNSAYNVRAKRTPAYGFLSKEVVWNVIGNYPNVFWKIGAGGSIKPFPYQSVWSDGTENLAVPVQWAKQTLMFHHSTLQQIEGEVGVIQGGMWRFDRPSYYKGHLFLQQGGTWDLLSGHVTGLSLREYIDYETLWAGAATVVPTIAAFPQAGGSASFLITCADDKEWDVTGLPDWLTASVERGTGSGTVTLFAGVNDYGSRTRTIYIAGVPVHVSQAQRNFDLYFEPEAIEATADGVGLYATVQASNDAAWKIVASDESWLLVNGLVEWEGAGYNDAVLIRVQVNESGAARTGAFYLYDGEDNLIQTIPVVQSVEGGGEGQDLTLTISTNVTSPDIALTVEGETVAYTPGMVIPAGLTVGVSVSKSGYITVTDSFTMSAATTSRYYELLLANEATVSQPSKISAGAQNVSFQVSDPSNHGWIIDYDAVLDTYITGGGVTSGNAVDHGNYISGTGNAVVYLTVKANTNRDERSISNTNFYFQDSTTRTRTQIHIDQLGTSGSVVLVSSITLNKNTLSLSVNDQETLVATVSPSNATNKSLYWGTSNSSVASVSQSGKVTAVGPGTCIITAYASDGSQKSATCSVTVTGANIPATGVTLNKSSITIPKGGTYTLIPTVQPPGATNQNVSWDTSDTLTAEVNSSGVVTGVRAGTCVVTVITQDGGFTATCNVTVTESGSMSAEDITVLSIATSASTVFTAMNMRLNTIDVSENVSWITDYSIDTSGNPYRVRLKLSANSNSQSRSATVTLVGTDEAGTTKTTTFTVTQNGRSPSDYPCTSMEIGGADTIANSSNEANYTAAFYPLGNTQSQIGEWSVVSGGNYVTLTPDNNQCLLQVKPGTTNQTVVLKATNYYNSSVYATKTITVSYIAPAPELTVTPANVTVHAPDTTDNTPTVTAQDITPNSLGVKAVSGFITSASIQNGKLVTVFSQNTGQEDRSGSVTVFALDLNQNEVTAVVTYRQAGTGPAVKEVLITGLNIAQTGGKVTMKIKVLYVNQLTNQTTFGSQSYTIKGYNGQTETMSSSGSLADKICDFGQETEIIERKWTGTLGMSSRYVLTFYSDGQTVTYEGDGNDIVD